MQARPRVCDTWHIGEGPCMAREKERWIWMSGWKAAERGTDTRRQRILLGKLLRWHTLLYPLPAIHPAPPHSLFNINVGAMQSFEITYLCSAHTRRLLGRRPRSAFPSLALCSLSAATRRNCAGTASIIREGPKWAAGRRLRSRARAAAYSWTIETGTMGQIILLGSESLPSFPQYHLSFICHFLVHLTDTAPDFGNHEHMRQSLERWPRPLPLLNWP